jgi:hypothetical protein
LSEEAGFTYTLQLPSGQNTFSYKAATDDASRNWEAEPNWGDVHGGNGTAPNVLFAGAYINGDRLSKLDVTIPFSTQPLSLLIDETTGHQASDDYLKFTKSFSPGLWGVWFCSIFFSALVYVLLEGSYAESPDFKGEAFHSVRQFFVAYMNSAYLAIGYLNGINSWSPVTVLGKVYSVMWAFVLLILVAAYTASSAAFLVEMEGTQAYAKSFGHFLHPKYKVLAMHMAAAC